MNILQPFFSEPRRGFLIRELAKDTKINHTTIRKWVQYYAKEGLLVKKPSKPFPVFQANTQSKKYLNLKLYNNLELIRKSELIERLEKAYNYPTIVLFGSFAKAIDDEKSDVDICIISDVQRTFDTKEAEHAIGRKISVHLFTNKSWNEAKRKNPNLINSIINGITLSGQLEVLS